MRDAPSRVVMEAVWEHGGKIRAYDPVATDEARRIYGERDDLALFSDNHLDAVENADCLVVVTEWRVFRGSDLNRVASLMSGDVIIDGRNIFTPDTVREAGLTYYGIGRK